MALSKGDDFPIHQTPEPIVFSGTDRNFYDRYFFNGYSTQAGNTSFFAVVFGVYPHLNIADAAFVVVRNGVETMHDGHGNILGVLPDIEYAGGIDVAPNNFVHAIRKLPVRFTPERQAVRQ